MRSAALGISNAVQETNNPLFVTRPVLSPQCLADLFAVFRGVKLFFSQMDSVYWDTQDLG